MAYRKPQIRISTLSRCLMLSLAVAAGSMAPLAATHAQSQPPAASAVEFDIPAGELAVALDRFAEQSGLQVVSDQPLLQDLRVPALRGRYAPEDALGRLLQGSGFGYERLDARTLVLKKQAAAGRPGAQAAARGAPARAQPAEPEVQDLQRLVVTGSRIRGGVTPSPVIGISAERIQEEGFTDLGEVIRSLSQNYGGGQNPGVTAGAGGGGYYNQNVTGGSAANLRGLGQDATLTLLNGRRMSYGGYDQAVDISAIPVEAVDRIEIVMDGASAIYGSDAVGGVANVILKRDFDGVAVGVRYGEATDGGLATREYNATAGTTWSTGGLVATWKKASNDPIYSHQRDYARDMYDPSTLYQRGDLRSGLFSVHQSLGNSTELYLDALRTERDMQTEYGYEAVHYRYPTGTTTSLVSPGVIFSLPNDWALNLSATWGKDKTEFLAVGVTTTTGEITLNRPFSYGNRSRMYELGAEGPLFSLPGGDARIATGAGYRYNDFLYLYEGNPTADGDEGSRFAYVELNLPLVGPGQNVAGVNRLELTGAIRTEDYDSYGRVTTPKIGVIYSPGTDFTLKASWGKSFKAPSLYQRYIYQFSYLYPAATFGSGYPSDATALYRNGGNSDLTPERARTWSASLAFHPEALPGLEAELTAFSFDYAERILQPITVTSQILSNPVYEQFVHHYPTAEEQAEIIATSDFINYTGAPYDPANLVGVIDNRFVNALRQRVKGVDLLGSYRFDLGTGRLTVRGSVSWLDSERSFSAASNYSDVAGILFYPAKIGGRAGAVWNNGSFTASFFGNYKSGVEDTVEGTKGASFTTFDTTLRYGTGEGDGIFADMAFELSVQNLLNRAPPLYTVTALSNAPYDSTNYSAIGRFLSFAISKHW